MGKRVMGWQLEAAGALQDDLRSCKAGGSAELPGPHRGAMYSIERIIIHEATENCAAM
jgi:hypothetical protein